MSKEDPGDFAYSDENLFDVKDQEPLCEYIDLEPTLDPDENHDAKTWVDNKTFGLAATSTKKGINLDPTIWEALAGEDRRLWEKAMQKELEGLEAMGTWEITDLPSSINTVDTRWVLKIKTDANLVPTMFKARLVVRGFTQKEGIDYTEIFALVAPIQSIRGVLAFAAVQD